MRSPCSQEVRLFLGCVAFFFASNSLSYLLMNATWRTGPVLGIAFQVAWTSTIGAQAALHCIWCVLAPLPWGKRFLAGATSGLVLYAGVVVAWFVVPVVCGTAGGLDLIVVVPILFCLPLLLLAAQTPLWIMRFWFRWRIAHRDAPFSTFRPLGIGHLLLAMAAIAMALAAARFAQSIGTSSRNENIGGLTVAALVIMVMSAITVLPALLAALYARRLPLALGLAFAGDAAVVVVYVAVLLILGGGRLHWEMLVVMFVLAGGFFVTLITPMLIARRFGYRLLCGRG